MYKSVWPEMCFSEWHLVIEMCRRGVCTYFYVFVGERCVGGGEIEWLQGGREADVNL